MAIRKRTSAPRVRRGVSTPTFGERTIVHGAVDTVITIRIHRRIQATTCGVAIVGSTGDAVVAVTISKTLGLGLTSIAITVLTACAVGTGQTLHTSARCVAKRERTETL